MQTLAFSAPGRGAVPQTPMLVAALDSYMADRARAPDSKSASRSLSRQAGRGKLAPPVERPGRHSPATTHTKQDIMFASATAVQCKFTIDDAMLRDQGFQLKLKKFIVEASDSQAHVAANGPWSPQSHG